MGDTRLACTLLGLDAESLWKDRVVYGKLLETFIYQELRRQASLEEDTAVFSHFRDKDKVEVDVIL